MSEVDLDAFLAMEEPPRKKRPRPTAEVVAYPQGGELAIAKAERTRKEELISAAEHNRRLWELLRREREEEAWQQQRRDGFLAQGPATSYADESRRVMKQIEAEGPRHFQYPNGWKP